MPHVSSHELWRAERRRWQRRQRLAERTAGGVLLGITIVLLTLLLLSAGCQPVTRVLPASVQVDRQQQVGGERIRVATTTTETLDEEGRVAQRVVAREEERVGPTTASTAKGAATGAGAQAVGTDLQQQVQTGAPQLVLGDGQAAASGGTASTDTTIVARVTPWALWVLAGLSTLLAIGMFWLRLQRPAWIAAGAAAVLVACALYPAFALLLAAAAAIAGVALYAWSERRGKSATEALRAVVAGVASAPEQAARAVKDAIRAQADPGDRVTIARIKDQDRL